MDPKETVYVCNCRVCSEIKAVEDTKEMRNWLMWYGAKHRENAGPEHRVYFERRKATPEELAG